MIRKGIQGSTGRKIPIMPKAMKIKPAPINKIFFIQLISTKQLYSILGNLSAESLLRRYQEVFHANFLGFEFPQVSGEDWPEGQYGFQREGDGAVFAVVKKA